MNSAAAELDFVSLAEALELTLLVAEREPEKYERAAARWHLRFAQEVPHVYLREAWPCSLSSRPFQRIASPPPRSPSYSAGDDPASESPEALVRWSRGA